MYCPRCKQDQPVRKYGHKHTSRRYYQQYQCTVCYRIIRGENINPEKKSHIIPDFRDMNSHAIGSGSIQAVNTLMFQKHDKHDPLNTTIYDVYKAKRNAEVAQGVGKETELIVLTKGKGCRTITSESFKLLKEIYDNEVKQGRTHPQLKSLKFSSGGARPCS